MRLELRAHRNGPLRFPHIVGNRAPCYLCAEELSANNLLVPTLIFLIDTFARLYLLTFLVRILLQAVRADFYNPISQFIVRVTNPLVVPARRFIPRGKSFDLPTFVVLVVMQLVITLIVLTLLGGSLRFDLLLWAVLLQLVNLTIWTYTVCIFVYVILSWVAQAGYSPIAIMLGQIVDPVLRPARRLLPPIGGLDLSPLIVLILLQAAAILLRTSIAPLILPPGVTQVIL